MYACVRRDFSGTETLFRARSTAPNSTILKETQRIILVALARPDTNGIVLSLNARYSANFLIILSVTLLTILLACVEMAMYGIKLCLSVRSTAPSSTSPKAPQRKTIPVSASLSLTGSRRIQMPQSAS